MKKTLFSPHLILNCANCDFEVEIAIIRCSKMSLVQEVPWKKMIVLFCKIYTLLIPIYKQ